MDILNQFPYLSIMDKILDKYQESVNSMFGNNPINSNPNKKHKKRKKRKKK